MGINNCHTCADMGLESKIIPGTNVNIILKNHGIEELHKKWHLLLDIMDLLHGNLLYFLFIIL